MTSNITPAYDTPCIIVATNSHVWIAKSVEFIGSSFVRGSHVRTIREWGSTKGLNQLVDGPTQSTVLDAPAPILDVASIAVIAIIPVRAAAWEQHLK
jgi:hypothetical protein